MFRLSITSKLAIVACTILFCLSGVSAEDKPQKVDPKKKVSEESKDITAQTREYNSTKYAAPPTNFNAGHVKPRKLDDSALKTTGTGYVVQFPSKAPVPTPAVYNDKIYVGGGFHSKEFYCLAAATGKLIWGFDLDDDGPSSAAVEDDVVVYNTESCTIFAHDAESGKLLWSYWLGDPLMSSPTIANGRVFTAYPAAGRVAGGAAIGQGQLGNAHQNAANASPLPVPVPQKQARREDKKGKVAPPMSHVLACFDLHTGKIIWQRWIDSDVMSAPVAVGKDLHVASFGGTLYKFNQADGKIISAHKQRATSAPVVAGDELVYSKRTDKAGEAAQEGIALQSKSGKEKVAVSGRALNVDATVQQRAKLADVAKNLDAGNGFAAGAPAAANPMMAMENVGQGNVSTLQSYQGARAVASNGCAWACPSGDKLVCTRIGTGKKLWEIKLEGDLKKEGGSLAAPPAAAGGRLFLSTLNGEVLEVEAEQGKIMKRHKIGSQTRFQPVIHGGRIFVTTQDGKLVCFNVGDRKLQGWTQWGGNAARTGVVGNLAKR